MFQNIDKVREYLNERNTSVFGLDAVRNLLEILGNPQNDTKFVHITGTNGKGSTGAYLINILKESGYKVGSFSSPQVFCPNEIIMCNYEPISDEDFVAIFNKVYDAILVMESKGMRLPTRFEIETAMAFLYFKEEKVDIAVVEVGMGGEKDATNVINNTMMEIITRISLDHTAILGDTLEDIAREKSGIIKTNSMVILAKQDECVMDVIGDKCNEIYAQLVVVGSAKKVSGDFKNQRLLYDNREYITSMIGSYQIYNMPLAIECARRLRAFGYRNITELTISNGIAKTILNGRFEVLGTNPIFLIDGAHNDDASLMLRESLTRYFEGKKLIYILGIFKDKDYAKILDNTLDLADEVITFDWDNPRHLGGEELRDECKKRMDNVHYAGGVKDAVHMALEDCDNGGVIVAFGSLSHLNDIRKAYKGVKNG